MTTLPSNIILARALTDGLYYGGSIAQSTAEWLFDVLADALANDMELCSTAISEIRLAHTAHQDRGETL